MLVFLSGWLRIGQTTRLETIFLFPQETDFRPVGHNLQHIAIVPPRPSLGMFWHSRNISHWCCSWVLSSCPGCLPSSSPPGSSSKTPIPGTDEVVSIVCLATYYKDWFNIIAWLPSWLCYGLSMGKRVRGRQQGTALMGSTCALLHGQQPWLLSLLIIGDPHASHCCFGLSFTSY